MKIKVFWAAKCLIDDVVNEYNINNVDEFKCPLMKDLFLAVEEEKLKSKKRVFLDDINQSWVSLDFKTGMLSSNSYIRDGKVGDSMKSAKEYWGI